jgi:PAS domain S-box-containing protein
VSQIQQILTFLEKNPQGSSVSEISAALNINRNLAAKNLNAMYMQGQVDLRSYGKVSLYQLCTRVPFHAISLMSDGIALGVDRMMNIREVSGPINTILNCTEEELIGVQLKDLKHAALSDRDIQDQIRQLIERKGSKPFIRNMLLGDQVFRVTLIACIFNDAMTGVGIQISDLSSLRMCLDSSLIKLNSELSIIRESKEFFVCFGQDEKIVFANVAYETYSGLANQNLIGKQGLPFISSQDMGKIREAYLSSHQEQTTCLVEVMAVFPDGDIRWQQWNVSLLFEDKNIYQVHLHGKDITEQKYQEMEIRELRRGIAHIFDEKLSDLRKVTLQLNQETEKREITEQRLKNLVNLISSLLSGHPVAILEIDSAGIITSVTIPSEISQIISEDQLLGYTLKDILFEGDSTSGERQFDFSFTQIYQFHRIPSHLQTRSGVIPVISSGITLTGTDEKICGMCIVIEFPSGLNRMITYNNNSNS